jgi:hypothetical protein
MGVQIQQDFLYEGNCPSCGSGFYIKLIGYEYPVGALDNQDEEYQGCMSSPHPELSLAVRASNPFRSESAGSI